MSVVVLSILLSVFVLGRVSGCKHPSHTETIESTDMEQNGGFTHSIDSSNQTAGCESEQKTENPADFGRAEYTREEILDMFNHHRYEFYYVISYLEILGDSVSYVAITDNNKQVSFSLSGNMERMINYTEFGYEKDEEFEQCLKTILVEGELGYLFYDIQAISTFGPNMPIMYSGKDLISNGYFISDDEFFGRIEGNWYFHVHEPV